MSILGTREESKSDNTIQEPQNYASEEKRTDERSKETACKVSLEIANGNYFGVFMTAFSNFTAIIIAIFMFIIIATHLKLSVPPHIYLLRFFSFLCFENICKRKQWCSSLDYFFFKLLTLLLVSLSRAFMFVFLHFYSAHKCC